MVPRMASVPSQQPFQLTKTPHGCSFVSPIGEIKHIIHSGEKLGIAPDEDEAFTRNSLTLCVPRQEASSLTKAMFKALGVQDGRKARMAFCSPLLQDYGENFMALSFSSSGPIWPPIVDAHNNPAPPAFKLPKGYHIRCAASARKARGIVLVGMTAIQIVKAPVEPAPFQFEPIEGGFRFPPAG
jgi:hypothetical protein